MFIPAESQLARWDRVAACACFRPTPVHILHGIIPIFSTVSGDSLCSQQGPTYIYPATQGKIQQSLTCTAAGGHWEAACKEHFSLASQKFFQTLCSPPPPPPPPPVYTPTSLPSWPPTDTRRLPLWALSFWRKPPVISHVQEPAVSVKVEVAVLGFLPSWWALWFPCGRKATLNHAYALVKVCP